MLGSVDSRVVLVVMDRRAQVEGQHADEVHRPDPAAEREAARPSAMARCAGWALAWPVTCKPIHDEKIATSSDSVTRAGS